MQVEQLTPYWQGITQHGKNKQKNVPGDVVGSWLHSHLHCLIQMTHITGGLALLTLTPYLRLLK